MTLKHSIKGKEVNFLVGLYALGKIREKYNLEITELAQKIQDSPTGFLIDIIYDSHIFLCELDNKETVISKLDLIEFIESDGEFNNKNGIVSEFVKYLHKTLFGDFPIIPEDVEGEQDEEEVKKK